MGSADRGRSLLLTGLMGTGKTSAGRQLARRLDRTFIDTDERVELALGLPVAEIFSDRGEDVFRAAESAVLVALPPRGSVIALGGGAIVSSVNREVLREKGTLVWLDATPETLADRLGPNSPRPLLAGLDRAELEEKLRALAGARAEAYASADVRVATDGLGASETATAVLEALGWGGAT